MPIHYVRLLIKPFRYEWSSDMNEVFLMCNGNVLNQVRIYNSSSLGLLGLGAGAIRSLLYHDCLYNHGIMNYFLIFIVHFLRRFEYLYITCFSVNNYHYSYSILEWRSTVFSWEALLRMLSNYLILIILNFRNRSPTYMPIWIWS